MLYEAAQQAFGDFAPTLTSLADGLLYAEIEEPVTVRSTRGGPTSGSPWRWPSGGSGTPTSAPLCPERVRDALAAASSA